MRTSGIIITALRGGSGKTIFSVGIIAALKNLGKTVAPFKKGPDYIDAGWLAMAAGRPCYNLDSFLMEPGLLTHSFLVHSQNTDFTVIEGNRGLYDCIDTSGETSTAELAKLLDLPVLLCLDCTKTTRTMAAVVSGCIDFDPTVKIKGVLLNRVGGSRHEKILRRSIQEYCNIPVLGAVPKLKQQMFPERHMGLVPTPEHDWAFDSIKEIGKIAQTCLDLDAIKKIASTNTGHNLTLSNAEVKNSRPEVISISLKPEIKIGVIKDSAFQFYYPENLDSLKACGAKIIFLSALSNRHIPDIDGLYIGGGFPETHAQELADNISFRNQLKLLAENGLPVYAECGGLIYLGQSLILKDASIPMTGVLPIVLGVSKKPQGHGYTMISVKKKNPFFKVGEKIKGHEFHYSNVLEWTESDPDLVFEMERGSGLRDKKDGLCHKNVLATYTHIHASGTRTWAKAFVDQARAYHKKKGQTP